jgi:hypothetical protein
MVQFHYVYIKSTTQIHRNTYNSPVQRGALHKHIQLSRFLILIQTVRNFLETLFLLLLLILLVVVAAEVVVLSSSSVVAPAPP